MELYKVSMEQLYIFNNGEDFQSYNIFGDRCDIFYTKYLQLILHFHPTYSSPLIINHKEEKSPSFDGL